MRGEEGHLRLITVDRGITKRSLAVCAGHVS